LRNLSSSRKQPSHSCNSKSRPVPSGSDTPMPVPRNASSPFIPASEYHQFKLVVRALLMSLSAVRAASPEMLNKGYTILRRRTRVFFHDHSQQLFSFHIQVGRKRFCTSLEVPSRHMRPPPRFKDVPAISSMKDAQAAQVCVNNLHRVLSASTLLVGPVW